MLHAQDIRAFFDRAVPRDRWLQLRELYPLVESNCSLDFDDLRPINERYSQPRWQRNVRAVLQNLKEQPEKCQWDPPARYRFPSQSQSTTPLEVKEVLNERELLLKDAADVEGVRKA